MKRNSSFSGTVTIIHPDTDEEFDIQYEGVYEPACTRGHIDNWTPDESWIELLELPEDLEFMKMDIIDKAWNDFNSN